MDYLFEYSILLISISTLLSVAKSETYSVKIRSEQHVNVVDEKFLSFTVDPKYIFSSSEKYNSKECVCMASSLTPAYIRIAGPSTAHMAFQNTTITFADLHPRSLTITHNQWRRFLGWAKSTGFDLVFALSGEERTASGLWDPNTALRILSVAETAGVGRMFWQLGYECKNQSIEEYLNDLQTLRVIIETFPAAQAQWRAVGGDVTQCLSADSKSDFKDYVTLCEEMMDAVLLNGNSSAQELERMSERDRLKLLHFLSLSDTPLWLTETPQQSTETPKDVVKSPNTESPLRLIEKSLRFTEGDVPAADLHRAADWMTSLGYSARNGFSVHFRELVENELYEPTLSFYMALLFKNLVGERVLDVDMEASQAVLFAHCTSLRHKPIPGAVTLFGANMDDEPARFSVKLSRREEGGDIMQFILGHDHNGNIVVNNRPMYYEGDIRPVVKRVRPYKTLLINLPPKSFGFWVLANTNIDACHNIDKSNLKKELVEADDVTDTGSYKTKVKKQTFEEYIEDESSIIKKSMITKNKTSQKKFTKTVQNKDGFKHSSTTKFLLETEKHGDNLKSSETHSLEAFDSGVEQVDTNKNKRSVVSESYSNDLDKLPHIMLNEKDMGKQHGGLKKRIDNLNDDLKNVQSLLDKRKKTGNKKITRSKRQILDEENEFGNNMKLKIQRLKEKINKIKSSDEPKTKFNLLRKLSGLSGRFNSTKNLRHDRTRKVMRLGKNKVSKRNTLNANTMSLDLPSIERVSNSIEGNKLSRRRRSILTDKQYLSNHSEEQSSENYIDDSVDKDIADKKKLWKILHKIHEQLQDLPTEDNEKNKNNEDSDGDEIVVKTKLSDDTTTINYSEKSQHGILKSTIENVLSVLADLNTNLNRVWNTLNFLE